MWGHLHCTWKKEWNAAAEAGASCCHASSSLCTGASQMKIRQDEKQQLCSLWDQLKTVLQLEQKEVKSDHSCKGTQGQRARHSSCLYSSCLLMQKAVGFLVSSGGAYGPWQSHEDMFSVDSGTDGVGPCCCFSPARTLGTSMQGTTCTSCKGTSSTAQRSQRPSSRKAMGKLGNSMSLSIVVW